MRHQKILNLLNEASDSRFVTRNWNIVNDQPNTIYDVGNKIIRNSEVLKSNLCDYNDAYILVNGDITIIGHVVTQVAFQNCATFIKYITNIDGTTINDAENLDLVVSMYSLIEYSLNYSDTNYSADSSWFYSKDEATNFDADIGNNDDFKFFNYKARLLADTIAQPAPNINGGILKNETSAVPLLYLSNFWGSLSMSLINCKVELKLKWIKYCVSCGWC